MLPIQYQNEFDRIIDKALPFLILAPLEERKELAEKCTFLFDHLRSESTEPYFERTSKDIFLLLKKFEETPLHDSRVSDFINLHAEYGERFIGVDKRFEKMTVDIKNFKRNTNKRISDMEKVIKNDKKTSAKVPVEVHTEVPVEVHTEVPVEVPLEVPVKRSKALPGGIKLDESGLDGFLIQSIKRTEGAIENRSLNMVKILVHYINGKEENTELIKVKLSKGTEIEYSKSALFNGFAALNSEGIVHCRKLHHKNFYRRFTTKEQIMKLDFDKIEIEELVKISGLDKDIIKKVMNQLIREGELIRKSGKDKSSFIKKIK